MATDELRARDRGLVHIGAVFQDALSFALPMQDVQHRLHRGVGQLALKLLLHRVHVRRPGLPEDIHNLQLERRQSLIWFLRHQRLLKA